MYGFSKRHIVPLSLGSTSSKLTPIIGNHEHDAVSDPHRPFILLESSAAASITPLLGRVGAARSTKGGAGKDAALRPRDFVPLGFLRIF